MLQNIKQFMRDEEGATAVEYGLIIGLIAVALVIVLTALGTGLSDLFDKVSTKITAAGGT